MTSSEVETILGVSNKTARKMIALLSDEIAEHGAKIEAKPGKGYQLEIWDRKVFEEYLDHFQDLETGDIENREEYLIRLFLETDGYLKTEDLMEEMYVSRKMISKALKEVEVFLEEYGLEIQRRPHYGMKVVGRESDFRRCLSELASEYDQTTVKAEIKTAVKEIFQKYGIKMPEFSINTFLNYMQISVDRFLKGKETDLNPENYQEYLSVFSEKDRMAAEECLKVMEAIYDGVSFPQSGRGIA